MSQAPATPLRDPAPARPPARRRRGSGAGVRREVAAGYTFLSPWLIGLMAVTAVPMLYSLYLSFTNWDLISNSGQYVGLRNYIRMFTIDPAFWRSVRTTVLYAVVATPLKLAAALAVAMLLARARRGTGTARALFYLPSLLGGSVALALVWQSLFSRAGAVNAMLGWFGLTGQPWVNDPRYVLWTIVLLGVWQFGAPMVIFIAGLKQIPTEFYEAAAVDGANRWRQFIHITLPSLSPVIFFNLVLETIHSFQIFTSAYVIGGGQGGPVDATKVYTLYTAGATLAAATAAVDRICRTRTLPSVRETLRTAGRGALSGLAAIGAATAALVLVGFDLRLLLAGGIPGGMPAVVALAVVGAGLIAILAVTLVRVGQTGGTGWLAGARWSLRLLRRRPSIVPAVLATVALPAVLAVAVPVIAVVLPGFVLFGLHAVVRRLPSF